MISRLWVLGASDPEMSAIEALLVEHGEIAVHALTPAGMRVSPANAGRAATPAEVATHVGEQTVYAVECDWPHHDGETGDVSWIDHHRPGDLGYGRPPDEFADASSIGQVARILGVTLSHEQTLIAAADHCLGAAYRGECPGVDSDELMRYRAASRAAFQYRTLEDVLVDIAVAQQALRDAPAIDLGSMDVCDMRRPPRGCMAVHGIEHRPEGWPRGHDSYCAECPDCDPGAPVPELVEAATRLGLGYVSGPFAQPDGRVKITCSGSHAEVSAFMYEWAPRNDLVDLYGDPARGFAGGYLDRCLRGAL